MRRILEGLLILSWLIASAVMAAGTAEVASVSEASFGKSVQASDPVLVAWFEARTRALGRDVYTYHYTPRARMGLAATGAVDPRDERLLPYLSSKIERFWDPRAPIAAGATVGGLYVATDPIAGRAFGGGGTGWALTEIVLAQGFRFIDVRDGGWGGVRRQQDAFPVGLRHQLVLQGCEAVFPFDLLLMLESQACRDVALQILADLDVDGLLYSFHHAGFPSCPNRSGGAFVVLRPNEVRLEESRLMTSVRVPGDDAEAARGRVQALYARAREAGSTRKVPWPEADLAVPAGFDRWQSESIFGCGVHAEDRKAGEMLPESSSGRSSAQKPAVPSEPHRLIAVYESILKASPDNVRALDGLAWILATAEDRTLREPTRAIELAEEMVRVTHYRDRKVWSKEVKIRAAHTLAVAHASGGSFERAIDYARWSVEVAGRLAAAQGDTRSGAHLKVSEDLLARFQDNQPLEPDAEFERPMVDWP